MQDRYAGDVGDFSKFALLRVLSDELRESIGLIWYLFPDETHTGDGRHVGYVDNPVWIRADRDLVTRLAEVVATGQRSVAALEASGVLPQDTRYFAEHVNWRDRPCWFQSALTAIAGAGIAMVDPDNGIAGPRHLPHRPVGGKHVMLSEICALADRHRCVVVYHHFDRSASHPAQMERWATAINEALPDHFVAAPRYRRISARAYFVISRPEDQAPIARALSRLSEGLWSSHFEWAL